MSESPPPAEEPASLADIRRLDRLCDRFEASWQEDGRPSLEAFLAEAPSGLRTEALRQLLVLEVEYRRLAGEAPALADYLPRFGDCRAVLDEILDARLPAIPVQRAPAQTEYGSAAATPSQHGSAGGPAPVIPGYEILGELGRGGMGIVYKARQVKARRVVALKMILVGPHAGPELHARFRTETEAVARLQHPNIVQLHEVGEQAGHPFCSLEFCPGGALDQKLAGTPLPPREAAALVQTLARAMHAAHQKGVVHRDLKPANVLLAEDGTPKVSDFGVAKVLDDATRTTTGEVLGTPSYMAPEQASGGRSAIGPACDVYALGAILYECLTGRPPFKGATVLDTLEQVCRDEPVSPRQLQPKLPRDLETICLKCLRKEPAQRYASAADLATELRRFEDGEPIRARPPSLWRRGVAWVRRRPVHAALILCGILLLATVIGGLSWHTAELTAALKETQRARSAADENEQRARQSEYASRMRLAQQSLKLGDPFVLPSLLDGYRPGSPQADDLRAFEWWYLTPYRQSAPHILRSHHGPIRWLAYSPDGRLLATAGHAKNDRSVKVWDARTRTLRFAVELPRRPGPPGLPAAFGPRNSGWLAVCDRDGGVSRWDLRTGKPLAPRLMPPEGAQAVAAHPDGRRLLLRGSGPVSVWDAEKGTCLQTFGAWSHDLIRWALSSDGNTLATTQERAPLRLWDVATGKLRADRSVVSGWGPLAVFPRSPLLVYVEGGPPIILTADGGREVVWSWGDRLPGYITAVAVSPGEQILATGHADGSVLCWDIANRSYRGQLRWQGSPITCLDFSPDGQLLAAGTQDGTVFQVSPPVRQEPDRLRPELATCGDVAFAADGRFLVVAVADRTVRRIDLATGQTQIILRDLLNPVTALALAPDGRTLATREENNVRLWDMATGKLKSDHPGGCFAFAPTGDLLAIGHEGIELFDHVGGSHGAVLRANASPIAIALSTDGRTLATADREGTVEFWDVSAGHLPRSPRIRQQLQPPASCLLFLPDGTLAAGEESGLIRFWQSAGDKLESVRSPLQCAAAVTRLAVSRDGQTLLARGPARDLYCWNLNTLKLRRRLEHYSDEKAAAALAPDGGTVATVGGEGVVELWDCKTCTVRLPGGQGLWDVHALTFTPDGRTLITASAWPERKSAEILFGARSETCPLYSPTTSLRFWDAASGTEQPGLDGPVTMAPPQLIALTPDGRTLAAGCPDGSIWLWGPRKGGPPFRRLFVSANAREYDLGKIEKLRALNRGYPIYPEAIRSLTISPDGRLLAAAGSSGAVTVWDGASDWQEVGSAELEPTGPTWTAFSPAGDLVLPQGGQVQFRAPGGLLRFALGKEEESAALCVAFSVRGDCLAVAHRDRRIRLWDVRTQKVLAELIGHLDQINALAFSPDGKTLASASHDRTVKLWSVTAAAEVASLEQHRGKVLCLAFAPDGATLASGGPGAGPGNLGEVYLWRAPDFDLSLRAKR